MGERDHPVVRCFQAELLTFVVILHYVSAGEKVTKQMQHRVSGLSLRGGRGRRKERGR